MNGRASKRGKKTRTRSFRPRNILLGAVIALVSLEVLLQLAGFLMKNRMRPPVPASGGRTILCVGDSFTYGLGAPRDESYPLQLERLLRRAHPGAEIRVVNLGVPGYNSSQCVKAVKEQIAKYRPAAVLVLAGKNNNWNFMECRYRPGDGKFNYSLRSFDAFLSHARSYKLAKVSFIHAAGLFRRASYLETALPPREFPRPVRSPRAQELIARGLECFEAGNHAESEEYYRGAMQLSPDDYEPHWYMGRFLTYRGDLEGGRREYALAARFAWHPQTVVCILHDIPDSVEPRGSFEFARFARLAGSLRPEWVKKFGEDYVRYYIDPLIAPKKWDPADMLRADLLELKKITDAHNARLIILSYPGSPSEFGCPEDVYDGIAAYLGVPLVDPRARFVRLLETTDWKEVLTPDGHCTGRGYGIIAEDAAEQIERLGL